ncbi:T9SS type A sorting domain-containing protein [Adhaeribacter soli]|uniref:T9SS type A sorting domain-containing protein n=1 Tax=Adhaeribacter soli TaxID=2607655 RepID=A0A5N1ITQ7_9BACT|nr:T9SS type A sorting domain-containing protein [Adhaeribacter soli]KAA9333545.1 T9SS type A sorting domain-containing protein [Adhaeribacter soli]
MKRPLRLSALLAMFCLGGTAAFAQNFQPFRKGPTYHFIAGDSLYSLRIDSVKVVAGDSVFVFNPIARKGAQSSAQGCSPGSTGPAAYTVHPNNQFGRQMRKAPNGEYIFRTVQGQEYLLKTKVATGQSWAFNPNNSTSNLTATLSAKTVETIQSVMDSVYTYTLSNGKTIKLSKNYGFTATPNFISDTDPYFKPKDLAFYALPEKGIGQPVSSPFVIFGFQPGDEFMYHSVEEGSSGSTCTEEWLHRTILSRRNSANGDSIYYSVREQRLVKSYGMPSAPVGWCQTPSGTTLHNPTTNTLIITKKTQPVTAALSNGFDPVPGFQGQVVTGIYRNSQFNQRMQMASQEYDYDPCSQTFNLFVHGGSYFRHGVGLGLVYSYGSVANYGFSTTTLLAYNKGSETYGTWRTLAQIMSTSKELEKAAVKAYPNPFNAEITLQLQELTGKGKAEITILNALGQVMHKTEAAVGTKELHLNLPHLAKGLYVVRVVQQSKVYSSRLVKD